MNVRIIGDVHGKYDRYIALTEECEYSIQIGDMGFDYKPLNVIDSNKHKFIPGNHDNYDIYHECPHVLTTSDGNRDYGVAELNGFNFFFVRGGFSIDYKYRQTMYFSGRAEKSYWIEEELTNQQMEGCLELYKQTLPKVVLSHECPRSISKQVGNDDLLLNFGFDPKRFTTKTSELLEAMFKIHQPKFWYFGHYHVQRQLYENGTVFICLPELGYYDIGRKEGE